MYISHKYKNKNALFCSLQIEYQLFCEENYFTSTCSVYCKGRNDHWGHYTCNPDTGAKECYAGKHNLIAINYIKYKTYIVFHIIWMKTGYQEANILRGLSLSHYQWLNILKAQLLFRSQPSMCVCVCMCVCVRACTCVRVCVCVCNIT